MRRFPAKRDALSLGLLGAAATCYFVDRAGATGDSIAETGVRTLNDYALGIAFSVLAIFGHDGTSALRKKLASFPHGVRHGDQVGIACLVEGVVSLSYLAFSATSVDALAALNRKFWLATCASAALNAFIKTLETKAFSMGEMSTCAPFLALEPIMQLLVSAIVMPTVCLICGWRCHEENCFTSRHALAVVSIAQGIFVLSLRCASKATNPGHAGDDAHVGGTTGSVVPTRPTSLQLPQGSRIIMCNCCLYCLTSRLDKMAIKACGSVFCFFACNRLIMALSCLLGSSLSQPRSGAASSARTFGGRLAPFLEFPVALCLLGVCMVETLYMLSLFKAISLISPVLVTAVKRGGGVIVSSLLGVCFFGEQLQGRQGPLLTVAASVTLLCI